MIDQLSSPGTPLRTVSALERIAEFAERTGRFVVPLPERVSWNKDEWLSRPFVHLRVEQGRVSVRGLRAWFGGHVILLPAEDAVDGVFAAWAADDDGVEIRNDRGGIYPLYYFAGEKEFAASPFLLTLLALGAPKALDDEALALFIRWGGFIGEQTPFRHIRALPPDCRLTWRRGVLQVTGGMWQATHREIDRSAAIDGYIDLFAQAVRRRSPRGPFDHPLSGGRDSRHILLELLRQGHVPRACVTMRHFPPRPNTDLEIAWELTKAAGLPHLFVDHPRSFVRTEMEKNLWTDLCTDDHANYIPLARFLQRRGTTTAYDGIGGDVLSGVRDEDRLKLFRAGRCEELAERMLDETRERVLAAVLHPDAYRRFGRSLAVGALAAELLRHVRQPNPVGSFLLWNRLRRSFALIPYRLYSSVPDVFAPYLDRDLLDFVTSLPGEMLLGRQFHIDVISRAFPKFAHLPFAAGWGYGPPRRDPWFMRRFTGALLARLAMRKSAFVHRGYLAPRLARRLWEGTDGVRQYFPRTVLHLLQLEAVSEGGR
ncbi:MAG: asparagine synthetase B family protein [Armatimonadota bacterium]|nr:asparagine synthetase B family protein [Armatimonadota bacterium]MDR7452257.1 asparagine synthetase B family protein [Armatimonadota bacterium]MDR7467979.1 asparagine synthetase B family protein [Armatimonadota bacterium]MDR7494821.1 asparagine synthetase B family protein [Armatimonadota bacterium]MDR7499225.1 asparagine synthetase B family protein [Armatimonadota bacterium]